MFNRLPVANFGGPRLGVSIITVDRLAFTDIYSDLKYANDNSLNCLSAGGTPLRDAIQIIDRAGFAGTNATLSESENSAIEQLHKCVAEAKAKTQGAGIPIWAYVAGGAAAGGLLVYLLSRLK